MNAISSSPDKKNIIVVGGAGLIGSHLCEALLKEARVICVDNLLGGDIKNIEHLLPHPDFVFVRHDATEPIDLDNLPETQRFKLPFQGVQEIFNLACPTGAAHFLESRLAIIRANSAAMRVTLDWAVKYKARYIFASSSVVYGQHSGSEMVKEDFVGTIDHLSERAAYDEGKKFAETVVATFSQTYNIDARIARLSLVYGPGMRLGDGHVLVDFINNALDNLPLNVPSTPGAGTAMLYVTDAVSALIKLAKASVGIKPMNIGGDEFFTFQKIAERVVALAQAKSSIKSAESGGFILESDWLDISSAKQILGWMPLIRLDDGLQHTIDFIAANRHRISMV